jgi:hypothetical protein
MSSLFANTIDQRTLERPPRVFAHRSSIRRRAITDAHAPILGAFAHARGGPPMSSLLGFETRLESGAIRPRPRAQLP